MRNSAQREYFGLLKEDSFRSPKYSRCAELHIFYIASFAIGVQNIRAALNYAFSILLHLQVGLISEMKQEAHFQIYETETFLIKIDILSITITSYRTNVAEC